MEQTYLVINVDRCWGCKTCQVACKTEHGLTEHDSRPIEVVRIERESGLYAKCEFVPLTCMHCNDPKCVAACPKDALFRDPEGLIQVNKDKCIGCGRCGKACPYGAVGLRKTEDGKRCANKCDLCKERRARGFLTSCEQHCLGGAITSCEKSQLPGILAVFPYQWSTGKIIYVSQKLSSLGASI